MVAIKTHQQQTSQAIMKVFKYCIYEQSIVESLSTRAYQLIKKWCKQRSLTEREERVSIKSNGF